MILFAYGHQSLQVIHHVILWIVLSRMVVQRDSFPGCPTQSFLLSLWFSQRVHRQPKALDELTSGLSAIRSATCKAAENDCLERRNSIRPRVSSRVAYKAERGGNELFWSPWKMYPRSQERHRNREATVYLPA